MMKKNYFIILLLMMLFSGSLGAQCGTGNLSNTTTSHVDNCGRNGSIRTSYTLNGANKAILDLYREDGSLVVRKPLTTATGTHTFDKLDAGKYQVKLVCTDNPTHVYATSAMQTIGGSYTPISATISDTNVCTNYTPGSDIRVSISGGNAPYKVLIKKTDDPNFTDENNYENVSGSTFSKRIPDFGTYQIRVKDNCENYKTFQYTIAPTESKIEFVWNPHAICGNSNQLEGSYWYAANPEDQGVMDFPRGGFKIEIRHDTPSGEVAYRGTITHKDQRFQYKKSASENYYVTTTNICGVTHSYQVKRRADDYKPERPSVAPSIATTGCGSDEKMIISNNFHNQTYWKYPINIKIKTIHGGEVYNYTSGYANGEPVVPRWYSDPININDYDLIVTDACGYTTTKRIQNPKNGEPFALDMDKTQFVKWRCDNGDPDNLNIEPLSEKNTIQVLLAGKGYLANRKNAVVTIVSGPSNKNIQAKYVDGEFWAWNNMKPGNYTVEFNSCNTTKRFNFSVLSNSPDYELLKQRIKSTASTDCQGKGVITSEIIYNGSHNYTVQLLDMNDRVLQENSSGNFNNLDPGSYKTRLRLLPWCKIATNNFNLTEDDPFYENNANTLTITGTREQLKVNKKTELICDNQQGTGCAYFELKGVAPFSISYTNAQGTVITLNNLSHSAVVCNLEADRTYNMTINDHCGASIIEPVTLRSIGSLTTVNTQQPCYNKPYTLSVPYFVGAEYQWVAPDGSIVSNSHEYKINNYLTDHDGTYIATVTWDNCVTRVVEVTLDGNRCGQPIQNYCFRPAGIGKPVLTTQHGITSLQRAGATHDNWPMVRKGAYTALESKTKGFVLNRLTTEQKNALTPVKGMMVYDTSLNCLSIYNGREWKCFNKIGCPN